ncbi:glycosyltransferase involved in cell wall biosynthesis [Kribbella sp. VKM Ac-2571]|uniref:glycosyltransferase family 4 protein n=1 Tax=Kribbella sp. VKM Ac-2571 TaxID=2512222 RepID=UPI0010E78D47|nr:glycosyltransferase family 4 protein [Kribbella sp. VKM Ac-2571]TDO58853.1 glycosyltransferase involved in cell wall biosynthesis [Kribbella sp. VKM Ac-2571]
MRIALVSDCYLPRLGGIELQVHDLAGHLIRAGHHVTVFTITDGPASAGDVPVLRLPAVAGVPLAVAVDRLRSALPSFDVVHCHSSLVSPLAWKAARLTDRAVLTLHSLPDASVPWPAAGIARYVGNVHWTAVSEAVAGELRRLLPDRPIGILHNGVDPVLWRHSRRTDHPLTIVSTMRLTRRKRPMALLRILEEIRAAVPSTVRLRAVVVGDGPRARAAAAAVRRRGLDEWVDLPGRLTRPDIQQLYASADVYVAPAELESFGVAALEARCAGLPVVAMASGGVGEFVRPGVEGFLVNGDSEMVATVANLLIDDALRYRIQRFNADTAPAMTWQHVVRQHLAVYRTQHALSGQYLTSAS